MSVRKYYMTLNDGETFSEIENCKIVMVETDTDDQNLEAIDRLICGGQPDEWFELYGLALGGIGIRHRMYGKCYTLGDGSCIGVGCIHDFLPCACSKCKGRAEGDSMFCQQCDDHGCKPE